MNTQQIAIIVIILSASGLFFFAVAKLIGWIRRTWRSLHDPDRHLPPKMDHLTSAEPIRKTYVLRAPTPSPLPKDGDLIRMVRPVKSTFTFKEERHAAASHQRLWIKYEDFNGKQTTREIDVYYPKEDDRYVFAWCRLKAEPRTFNRHNILQWQFINDTFEFNPLVERYFQEEGSRDRDEKIPWKRWLERQPRP